MAQITEAAFLAGYEPSEDNMTAEAMLVEAQEFLIDSVTF